MLNQPALVNSLPLMLLDMKVCSDILPQGYQKSNVGSVGGGVVLVKTD